MEKKKERTGYVFYREFVGGYCFVVAENSKFPTAEQQLMTTIFGPSKYRHWAYRVCDALTGKPISFNGWFDREAAEEKGAQDRPGAGKADILLFPDIHAGNLVYKAIVHMVDCKNGCILTGTKAPVVLTSRSDTFETKVNSIALGAIVAEELSKKKN